jgi:hypothetical protein
MKKAHAQGKIDNTRQMWVGRRKPRDSRSSRDEEESRDDIPYLQQQLEVSIPV